MRVPMYHADAFGQTVSSGGSEVRSRKLLPRLNSGCGGGRQNSEPTVEQLLGSGRFPTVRNPGGIQFQAFHKFNGLTMIGRNLSRTGVSPSTI